MSENDQKKRRLTAKQKRAIEALLSGQTKGQAAVAAGITTRTLARWREHPAFDHELRSRSTEVVADATRRLTGTLGMAVITLRRLMQDETVSPSVQLRAALGAANLAVKYLEVTEVIQRLDALEEVMGVNA